MRIGYLITARLKSSRLKKKILLPLNGNTVIDHVINRCKSVNNIDDVILCTSTNSQDSVLSDYAFKHKIKYFEGSEDDVLKRLLDAAHQYNIDAFLSITADNPLHSIHVSNIILEWVKKEPVDFVFTSGLPIGLTPYFINTKALEIAVEMKENSDTEIWGPFVNRPDFFSINYLNIITNIFPRETRLTCDYIEDYNLLLSIYNQFNKNHIPTIFEVADLINNKKVLLTNSSQIQMNVPEELLDEIKSTFNKNMEKGKAVASKIQHYLKPKQNTLNINL